MLWIALLFHTCGLLHGYRNMNQAQFFRKCCEEGMEKAEDGQHCSLYLLSSNQLCSMVSEQCCKTTLKVILCDKGIRMAQQQQACETSFFEEDVSEVQSAKMCCECCTLGMTLSQKEMSCDLLGLFLGEHCRNIAESCCTNTTIEGSPTHGEVTTPKPKGCAVIKCAQLCVGDGVCTCHPGYQMQHDGVNCKDINECHMGTHNCEDDQTCLNTEGSFLCQGGKHCDPGYELTQNSTCKDIDECALGTHTCGSDLVCNNTEGSFSCQPKAKCAEGFTRDANKACIDVNECGVLPSPCTAAHTCINTIGSFICRSDSDPCGRGFLMTVDGLCEDVDECQTGHPCGANGKCVNGVGSFYCECQSGFTFNKILNVCEDINECMNVSAQLCAQNCENTEGSFQCSCSSGFKLAHDGRSCDDINECADGNHNCSASETCFNLQGGFRCLSLHCPETFERTERRNKDSSITVRCVKACQPEDANCLRDPVHVITHSVLILPIFEDLEQPEEIVLLRTIAPASPEEPDAIQVFFALLTTDEHLSFDVVKHTQNGMIAGVVRQVKPIHTPKDIMLEVGMSYVKSGVVSYRNFVIIHVFISKYDVL